MNRFAFGLLVLVPLAGGCGKPLYITSAPDPDPTPKPPAPPLEYPFDPNQGIGLAGASGNKGLALNGTATPGLPASFRAADVVFAPRSSGDTANYTPLLVLQSASTDAKGVVNLGTSDTNNPVRLAGVIVPAPGTPGYEEALQATRNWAQGQPTILGAPGATAAPGVAGAPGATPAKTALPATATPTPIAGTRGTAMISVVPAAGAAATATLAPGGAPAPVYGPSQSLDVYEDPKYPIDSQNRRLVQVFFKSGKATKTVLAGTSLSLNRMLIRAGWAVVDLYSPTSFDQQSWLLDESYARKLRLGLWKYGATLQQRAPVESTGTGVLSNIPITLGSGTGTAKVPGTGTTVRGSAPAPTATATLAPGATPVVTDTPTPAPIPRLPSGSKVTIGSSTTSVLPPASSTSAAPAASASAAPGGPRGGNLG